MKKVIRECSVKGCKSPIYAKGVCTSHYRKEFYKKHYFERAVALRMGVGGNGKKCAVCQKTHYARGYCRKHYTRLMKTGKLTISREVVKNEGEKCKVHGCVEMARSCGYCSVHYAKFKKYGNPTYYPKKRINYCGENNPRWNGGVSYYKEHYVLKRNRLIKIALCKGVCERRGCKKKALKIHHKNGNIQDHTLSNLELLCNKHWYEYLQGKAHSSVYVRDYGFTQEEIARRTQLAKDIICKLHNAGTLLWLLGALKIKVPKIKGERNGKKQGK